MTSTLGRERFVRLGARAVEADVFDVGEPNAWDENDRLRTEASAAIAHDWRPRGGNTEIWTRIAD